MIQIISLAKGWHVLPQVLPQPLMTPAPLVILESAKSIGLPVVELANCITEMSLGKAPGPDP